MTESIKIAELDVSEHPPKFPTKAMFQKALDTYTSTMTLAEFHQIDRKGCSIFAHWKTDYPETLVCGVSIGGMRMGSDNPKVRRVVSVSYEANQDKKANTKETKKYFILYCSNENSLAEQFELEATNQDLMQDDIYHYQANSNPNDI